MPGGLPPQSAAQQTRLFGFRCRVNHVMSVILLFIDGSRKSTCGITTAEADHLSAVASGLYSLAYNITGDDRQSVRHVVVELDKTLLFVSAVTRFELLAVEADRRVDISVLAEEMYNLIRQLRCVN